MIGLTFINSACRQTMPIDIYFPRANAFLACTQALLWAQVPHHCACLEIFKTNIFIANLFIQKNTEINQNETFISIIPEPTQNGQFFQLMNTTWCMPHTLRNGPSNQTFRPLPIYFLLRSLCFQSTCCVSIPKLS